MKREEVISLMDSCGLSKSVGDSVMSLAESRNSLEIVPQLGSPVAVGSSKVGGVPDFPPGDYAWPGFKDRPFLFLGQINLGEIPSRPERLPAKGLLYFFLFEEDFPCIAKVILAPHISNLQPSPIHEMLPESDVPEATGISFTAREDIFLPKYDSPSFNSLGLQEDDRYAFEDFEYEVEGDSPYNLSFFGSQLLGEWNEAVDVAWSQFNESRDGWVVLLILDPFQDKKWTQSALAKFTGINRRVYFYIQEDALKQAHFSNIRVAFGES